MIGDSKNGITKKCYLRDTCLSAQDNFIHSLNISKFLIETIIEDRSALKYVDIINASKKYIKECFLLV